MQSALRRNPLGCEHVFVSIKGSPYARFRRALDTGNIAIVRAAAAELPTIGLQDALRVCLLLREAEPEMYNRAVIRWLGRFCLERPDVTLYEVRQAAELFHGLPADPHNTGEKLSALARPPI
jgi:hypothetical protein